VSAIFLLLSVEGSVFLPYFVDQRETRENIVSQKPNELRETTAPVARHAATFAPDVAINNRAFWTWAIWDDKSLLTMSLLSTRAERTAARKRLLKRA
jgi:hypothetical protein